MSTEFTRRQFVGALGVLPFAFEAAARAQRVSPEEAARLRAAHGRTGIAAAGFSRIRNADLGRSRSID